MGERDLRLQPLPLHPIAYENVTFRRIFKGAAGMSANGLPAMLRRPPAVLAAVMGLRPSDEWRARSPVAPALPQTAVLSRTWDFLVALNGTKNAGDADAPTSSLSAHQHGQPRAAKGHELSPRVW